MPSARHRRRLTAAVGHDPVDRACWVCKSVTEDWFEPTMDDLTEVVLYRLAYGHAVRLADLRGYSATDPRGDRAAVETEAIHDVVFQHRVSGPADEAIVREAVEGALTWRRPRW